MLKIDNNDNDSKSIDNKYYIVVGRNNKQTIGRINKFKNDKELVAIAALPMENQILRKGKLGLQITFGSRGSYTGNGKEDLIKSFYRWDGVCGSPTPEIDSSGNINGKQPIHNDFQKGILFSLSENDKTATWSNNGIRLTMDGGTKINIDNPNVEEVYWGGSLQQQSSKQLKINVKPGPTPRDHKLVIKYDINGTKYTSKDIMVSMLAKIDLTPTPQCSKI